jgi:antitoxin component YwqK of YwqJK toxin-antitoxin module
MKKTGILVFLVILLQLLFAFGEPLSNISRYDDGVTKSIKYVDSKTNETNEYIFNTNGLLEKYKRCFANGDYYEFFFHQIKVKIALSDNVHLVDLPVTGEYRFPIDAYLYKFYAASGLTGITNLKNGKENGESSFYYPNGALKTKGLYVDGLKQGNWFFYYDNGSLKSTPSYQAGRRIGLYKTYYANGKLESASEYDKNCQLISVYDYYEDSKFQWSIEKIKNSKLYLNKTFYPNGQLADEFTSQINIDDKGTDHSVQDGQIKRYYENGTLKCDGFYDNGKAEGAFKFYYDTGELYAVVRYKNNEKIGDDVFYEKNGTIKQESTDWLNLLNLSPQGCL